MVSPAVSPVICEGAGAGQVRLPLTLLPSAAMVEAVSTTVDDVVAVCGATGWPADAGVPVPAELTAAMENDQNAFAGDSPLTVKLAADAETVTVCGVAPGAGTHCWLELSTISS